MYSRKRCIGAIGRFAADCISAAGLGPRAFDRFEELTGTVHTAPQEAAADETSTNL